MKRKIKKTEIDSVRKQAGEMNKRLYVYDTALTGFGCMATPTGSVSYFVEYRFQGNKRRKSIGRHGPLTPDTARKKAQAMLGEVAQGIDPSAKLSKSIKLQEIIEAYYQQKSKGTRYWREAENSLVHHAKSLLKKDIQTISRADIARLIDDVSVNSQSAGRTVFAAMRPIFKWAVERGHIDLNPCQELTSPRMPAARERILNDQELVKVWEAASNELLPFGPIVQLLILTGQRRSEVAGMRWSEIQDDLWTIQGARTKNGKLHQVHLSPLAMSILDNTPKVHDLIFSTTGNTIPSGFSRAKRRIDNISEVQEWRYHDLRRTFASGLASIGILPDVIEHILNHRSGLIGGLRGVYQRYEYLEERKTALHKWSHHVKHLIR